MKIALTEKCAAEFYKNPTVQAFYLTGGVEELGLEIVSFTGYPGEVWAMGYHVVDMPPADGNWVAMIFGLLQAERRPEK